MGRFLALLALVLVLAGCAEAPIANDPSAQTEADIACDDITPNVVALADFPVPVHRIDEQSTVRSDGVTSCLYGDTAGKKVSVNALGLIIGTKTYLDSRSLAPTSAIKLGSHDCVAGSERTLGDGDGLGSAAFFCVGTPGSVRGAWIHGDAVYNLNYFSTTDEPRPTADRLDTFETIAKAIDANIQN